MSVQEIALKLTELTIQTRIAFSPKKGKTSKECQDEVESTYDHFKRKFTK